MAAGLPCAPEVRLCAEDPVREVLRLTAGSDAESGGGRMRPRYLHPGAALA